MYVQSFENKAVIQQMVDSGEPYYWVNVGVRKYFTTDLIDATGFFNRVGDSLFRGDANWGGDQLAVIESRRPSAYRVEVEFELRHDIVCTGRPGLPENYVSTSFSQSHAERVFYIKALQGIRLKSSEEQFRSNIGRIRIRLVRVECGTMQTAIGVLKPRH